MAASTPAPAPASSPGRRRRPGPSTVRELRLIGLAPPDPDARRPAGARLRRGGRDYAVANVERGGANADDGPAGAAGVVYLHLIDPTEPDARG